MVSRISLNQTSENTNVLSVYSQQTDISSPCCQSVECGWNCSPASTPHRHCRSSNSVSGLSWFTGRSQTDLPRHCMTYKMAVLAHKVLATSTPAYLSDVATPARRLRSSHAPLLMVPRTRTDIARRAFSVAAPFVWNSHQTLFACATQLILLNDI